MKKIMRIQKLILASFFRSLKWKILLAVGLVASLALYYMNYGISGEKAMTLQLAAYGQMMLTLVFLMMGIETQRDQASVGFFDVAQTFRHGTLLFAVGQCLALGVMAIMVGSVMIIGCLTPLIFDGSPALWLGQVAADIVLQYVLPCWILGMVGTVLTQWIPSRSVYIPAMIFWMLTGSIGSDFFGMMRTAGFPQGMFLRGFFNMGIMNFRWPQNFVSGAAIELPRWVIRVGWLLLLHAVCVGRSVSRSGAKSERIKGMGLVAMTAVLAVAFGVGTYDRYHVFYERFSSLEVADEYAVKKYMQYRPGEPVSLTDAFPQEKKIKPRKTDIVFSSGTQGMTCHVTMKADITEDSPGQSFTLYSDLMVDQVWVDGQPANFERSYDGLMVHYPEEKKAGQSVEFVFEYHGYSLSMYPVNETTVQLNRSFPWFPWPGIKNQSSYENLYDYNVSEKFFVEPWQQGDEVEYTLSYRGPGFVYTNLSGEKGRYHGVSTDGISLYSGMIAFEEAGVTVYTPANKFDVAGYYAQASLAAFPVLQERAETMGTVLPVEKPEEILVIEMQYPSDFGFQNIYTRGTHWEFREENVYSPALAGEWRDRVDEQQFQEQVKEWYVGGYLVSPSTGYPVNSSHVGHSMFTLMYRTYRKATTWDEAELDEQIEFLISFHLPYMIDIVNGERTISADTRPINKKTRDMARDVLQRMQQGENFDPAFRAIYQRLIRCDAPDVPEFIEMLYLNEEV